MATPLNDDRLRTEHIFAFGRWCVDCGRSDVKLGMFKLSPRKPATVVNVALRCEGCSGVDIRKPSDIFRRTGER
jgi:hypothetical protein